MLAKIAAGKLSTLRIDDRPKTAANGVFLMLGLFHVKKGLLENFFKHEVGSVTVYAIDG